MEIDYKKTINAIITYYYDKLTEWEVEFIASVYDWHIELERNLSAKQKECLDRINNRLKGRL